MLEAGKSKKAKVKKEKHIKIDELIPPQQRGLGEGTLEYGEIIGR